MLVFDVGLFYICELVYLLLGLRLGYSGLDKAY